MMTRPTAIMQPVFMAFKELPVNKKEEEEPNLAVAAIVLLPLSLCWMCVN